MFNLELTAFCVLGGSSLSIASQAQVFFRAWRVLTIQKNVVRVKEYMYTVQLVHRVFALWRTAGSLAFLAEVLLCSRAANLKRKFLASWKSQLQYVRFLHSAAARVLQKQKPEIFSKNFRAWHQLVLANTFHRQKFPIIDYFRVWRRFRQDRVARVHLHVARENRKFLARIFRSWREGFFARLRKRVGNLKLLALTSRQLEISRMRRMLDSWRQTTLARVFRDRKFLRISVHAWKLHILRRRVKRRHLEISMHKYLLEKSADFARLLISTLDARKTQRMHSLMTVHRARMEIYTKYFRLWRDLVN